MRRQVQFNPDVKRAVYRKRQKTDSYLENVPSAALVDEEEIASRNSEYQLINENQKRALLEHHFQKKICHLSMCDDIIDVFGMAFEDCCWQPLTESSNDVSPAIKETQQY